MMRVPTLSSLFAGTIYLAGCGGQSGDFKVTPADTATSVDSTATDSGADSTPADTSVPADTSDATDGPTCAAPKKDCSGVCADLMTDVANCGACAKACTSSETCTAGVCNCKTGTTKCSAGCTDTATDPANCGTCGKSCATGEECKASACVCKTGTTSCGGVCVDTKTDPKNCGSCGTVCTAGCTGGLCDCPSGKTNCSGDCVDTKTDALNCGACGKACAVGEVCAGSVCGCPTGTSKCGTACVDLSSDPKNCKTCGTVCPVSAPDCKAGACVKAGVTYSEACSGTLTSSSTQCLNWDAFRAKILATTTYNKITIKSDLDTTGGSCTGATANTLCQALRTGTATVVLSCDGRNWQVGVGCGPSGVVELTATGSLCACNTGYTARPCINNNNWGNGTSTGSTCSGVAQTLIVTCE